MSEDAPDVLAADNDYGCSCCHVESVPLWQTRNESSGIVDPDFDRTLKLCAVCRGTFAGNAAIYPDLNHPGTEILKTIAGCTNVLLKEVRALRAEVAELKEKAGD